MLTAKKVIRCQMLQDVAAVIAMILLTVGVVSMAFAGTIEVIILIQDHLA